MMRALLLRLLGGVPVEHHVVWTEHHMATSGKVQDELRKERDALRADLARVTEQRDEWCRQCNLTSEREADTLARIQNLLNASASDCYGLIHQPVAMYCEGLISSGRLRECIGEWVAGKREWTPEDFGETEWPSGQPYDELRAERDAAVKRADVAEQTAAWWQRVAGDDSLIADKAQAYLRWLETGEGEEPLTPLQEAEKRITDLEAKLAEQTECADAWKRKAEGYQRRAAGLLELEQVQKATELACEVDTLTAKLSEVEAKLAEATSPIALAERRYAQAWRVCAADGFIDGSPSYQALCEAEGVMLAAYAAAAKGEGGEGER